MRAVLLGLIVALYALSIPWYRASGEVPSRLLGLPDWVAVALACYVGVAILNAWAWLRTDVPDAEAPGPEVPDADVPDAEDPEVGSAVDSA